MEQHRRHGDRERAVARSLLVPVALLLALVLVWWACFGLLRTGVSLPAAVVALAVASIVTELLLCWLQNRLLGD